MTPGPPALARLLIRAVTRSEDRDSVLRDLGEEFDALLSEGHSRREARAWYRRQVIASVIPLLSVRRGPGKLLRAYFLSEGGMFGDVKVGARMLLRRPGFSLIVVLTLALGIGATSAVFSLIQGVLLTPPPYESPDRLALVTSVFLEDQEGLPPDWSAEQWLGWRDDTRLFESVAAYMWTFNFTVSEEGSEALEGMMVSHAYFDVIGVHPALGRTFDEAETGLGESPPVVIIGHDLWMQKFGGDPGVIGQPLRMSRRPNPPIIVGVMPPGVRFLPDPRSSQEPNYDVDSKVDYWTPIEVTRAADPDLLAQPAWNVVGRLSDGVSPAAAEAELGAFAARLAETSPRYAGVGVRVQPVVDFMNRDGRRILFPLLAAAALVLLIACGNTAALLLVRGLQRQQEYGVRSAIGAGRIAVLRLVTVESLILALAGGALGVILALGVVRGFKLVGGHAIPRLDAVSAGWPVILFGLAAALVATVVAGIYPAVRASRKSAADSMRGASGRTTDGRKERRVLSGITMVQASLTLMLLVGAGLLIQTMHNLAGVDSGFETDGVLTMSVTAVEGNWTEFHVSALEAVSALPGVQHAAFAWGVPLTGNNWPGHFEIEGREELGEARRRISIPIRSVTTGYFDILNQPIVEGRDFAATDDRDAPGVAIVNEAFVNRYLGGDAALGRRLAEGDDDSPIEIVGVVGDSRTNNLTVGAEPEVYRPLWQAGAFSKHLVVKTSGASPRTALDIQQALRSVEPTVAVQNIKTLNQIRDDSWASQSFAMQLLVGFALVACLLTLGGIYGVLSLSVAARRREIAIRTAIGAARTNVVELVMREGVRVVVVGLIVGLVGAAALSRILGAFLFGVEPSDPTTLAVMALLFAAVALFACWIPARRATAIDPAVALREE